MKYCEPGKLYETYDNFDGHVWAHDVPENSWVSKGRPDDVCNQLVLCLKGSATVPGCATFLTSVGKREILIQQMREV